MDSDGARTDLRRTVRERDTVTVRNERGVIVVECVTEWGRARQRVKVPEGWSVELKRAEPEE